MKRTFGMLSVLTLSSLAWAASTIPPHVRGYDLGLTYGPGGLAQFGSRTADMERAYDKIKEVGEMTTLAGNWSDWEAGTFAQEIRIAREKGLKVHFYMDLLTESGRKY